MMLNQRWFSWFSFSYDKVVYATLFFLSVAIGFILPDTALAVTGLASALFNLQDQLDEVWIMLIGITRLCGIGFTFMAVYKLKVYGRMTAFMSQEASILQPMAYLFVGAMLWYTGPLLDYSVSTIWGYDYSSVKSYDLSSDPTWSSLIEPITLLVRVIGLIAFLRGWFLILKGTQKGQQQGLLGKGVLHIVGGILAINLIGTVELLRSSFGF